MHISKTGKVTKVIRSFALSQSSICRVSLYLTLFALAVSAAGCAAAQSKVKKRYFFPPLPDTPRVEYLGVYASQHSFPKAPGQAFRDSLTGQDEPLYFDKPWGIAPDGKGKVYVADTALAQVMIYDMNAKTVKPLGGAEGAGFLSPVGVAVDGDGSIYVSDSKKNRVFVYDKDEKPLYALGEDGSLDWPAGLAIDRNLKRLYVVNAHGGNIAVFDLSGKYITSISKKGGRDGYLNFPNDVDIDSKGNLVVSDSMNARVQIFSPDGRFIRKFGQRGDGLTDFQMIKGVAVDKKTDNIYVVDGKADRVLIFDKEGVALLVFGSSMGVTKTVTPGGFLVPMDINIDENGTMYIVDSMNRRFQVFQIVDDNWLKEHPIEK